MRIATAILALGIIGITGEAHAQRCVQQYRTATTLFVDPFCPRVDHPIVHGTRPRHAYPPAHYGSAYRRPYVQHQAPVRSRTAGPIEYRPSVNCAAMGGIRAVNPATGNPSCFVPDRR